MKKKIIKLIPYILGLIYFTYCMFNIEHRVKSHMGFDFYVIVPCVFAILISVVLLILNLFFKKKCNFYFPLFLFIMAVIITVVGSGIPCCTGG